MRLLLDTHIVLWGLADAPQLTRQTRTLMQSADALFVSSVTLWETAIKISLGKLAVDLQRLEGYLRQNGMTPLHVTWEHAMVLRQLPRLHGDPFDRMLVAQAMSEPMHLLTHDANLAAYSPLVMVV